MAKQNPMYDAKGRIRFDGVEKLFISARDETEGRETLKYYCLSGLRYDKNQRIAKTKIDFVLMDMKKQNDIRERGGLPRLHARLYFAKSSCFLIKENE